MLRQALILCSILVCFGQINCVLNPKVVCYYEDWYYWRSGDWKMTVENVDSSLCTHTVYAYQGIDKDSTIKLADEYLMKTLHDLDKFSHNKGKSQALVAIGGWSLAAGFPQVISTDSDIKTFTKSIVTFLNTYHFDGVMLDWTPKATFTASESAGFVKLLASIRAEFGTKYTLGITVYNTIAGLDVSKVDSYVDIIAVQTYELHGGWEKNTGIQDSMTDIMDSLRGWYKNGATAAKLIPTIPLYGKTWILANPDKYNVGADATGPGKMGPGSQQDGKLGYNEFCVEVKKDPTGWKAYQDKKEVTAYAVKGRNWISYDDIVTAESKTKTITSEGFGGVVVQALENDDYKGLCGEKYPLLKAINKGLNKDPVPVPTRPTLPPTPSPTPGPTSPTSLCHKAGLVKDPKDCHYYHKCTEMFPGIYSDERKACEGNLAFDERDGKCKDRKLVPGC